MTATRGRLLPRSPTDVPLQISNAAGIRLFGSDGRSYLDGSSGVMIVNLGYTNPAIVDAMTEAASVLPFAYERRVSSPQAEALADAVCALAPPELRWAFFLSSGADALEMAFRIAMWYQRGAGRPERVKVIGTSHGYHGSTLGALQVTGHPVIRGPYGPVITERRFTSSPFCRRCPLGLEHPSCELACARELGDLLGDPEGADIAAFVTEPVLGNSAGAVVPPPGYLRHVRATCDEHDVLLIVDEIVTGLGRTGRNFAVDHVGVVPDILCLGKALGAGYAPISAVLVSDRVVRTLPRDSYLMGHTCAAHPVASAVARVAIERLCTDDLVTRAEALGARLGDRLSSLRGHPLVSDVRGTGLLWGVELDDAAFERGGAPSAVPPARVAYERCLDHGLMLCFSAGSIDGRRGQHLTVAPPLVSTDADIDEIVDLLRLALDDVLLTT